MFGTGIDEEIIHHWAEKICCKTDNFPSTYLGLPLGARQNALSVGDPIIRKFKRKLSGWKAERLTLSGRIILINSVFASLPTYYMSLFRIPAATKNRIDTIQKRFLWGGSKDKKKIHWVAWNYICQYKELGGLGFVDIKLKNKALLCKWIWRFAEEKGPLWRNIIVDKYGGDLNSLTPDVNHHNSFSALKDGKVNECGMFGNGSWTWRINLRRRLFDWEKAQWNDLMSDLGRFYVCDFLDNKLKWKGTTFGKFSSRAFCRDHLNARSFSHSRWKTLWSGLLPPKVKAFCRQLIKCKIAVKANLASFNLLQNSNQHCSFCRKELETESHCFSWKQLDLCKLVGLVKFRVEIWAKAEWPQLKMRVTDFIRSPGVISLLVKTVPHRFGISWIKPPEGSVKFNVDSSSLGKPGPAGIGEILKDHLGNELIRFSKSIELADSNEAELLATREALLLFENFQFLINLSFIKKNKDGL
ncbi:hypothetical protein DITRI_Ditri18aG0010600 [Diplodiscus trichospermus]